MVSDEEFTKQESPAQGERRVLVASPASICPPRAGGSTTSLLTLTLHKSPPLQADSHESFHVGKTVRKDAGLDPQIPTGQDLRGESLVSNQGLYIFLDLFCSLVGKPSACSAGDQGSIPGLGGSPGEGNGNPLQYSCLKNPMDRGVWRATGHGVARHDL